MKKYKADLHVHTVLSPCGDLGMSPSNIIRQALRQQINMLAITDHNSTLQCPVTCELGAKAGIWVIPGAEINSSEEVHGLALFDSLNTAARFQSFLDEHLTQHPNKPALFGHQVVVNQYEEILREIEPLLISALDASIEQIAEKIIALNGIFIPAHINRQTHGILNQLGFIPDSLPFHALEITGPQALQQLWEEIPSLSEYCFIRSSDAHYIDQIGTSTTQIMMENLGFEPLKEAFANHKEQIFIE